MEKQYTSVNFTAKVKPIKPLNSEFSLVKITVQGVGKNRNMSYMSKNSILSCLPTLNYCPVVGHIIEAKDNEGNIHRYMGSHDYTITDDWEFKSLTVPFGVIVEDSFDFEVINEYGVDVEYLTANAILWTGRYPELYDCIYSEDVWFNQSMELNLEEGKYRPLEEDSNYTELLEWTYSACCLLGKADSNSTNGQTESEWHSEPCFISSKVTPIEFSKSEFSDAMNEMKEKIASCFSNHTSNEDDIDNSQEGGLPLADEIKTPVEEIVEEVVEEVTEIVEEENNEEVIETPAEESEVINTEETVEEVAEEVTEEEPTVEENEETISKAEYDSLASEFAEYKELHSHTNEEFDELFAFKEEETKKQRQNALDSLFAKFDKKLSGYADYEALKASEISMEIEDLEEKLFAMIGKKSANFSVQSKETVVTVPVDTFEVTDDDGYGGILSRKYSN